MRCELIQKDLVEFHFGTLGASDRKPMEEHLCECKNCLNAYFSMKTHFEIDVNENIPEPSLEMKTKLSNEVMALFPPVTSKPYLVPQRRNNLRIFQYGSVVAAMAVVVFFLVVGSRHLAPVERSSNQTYQSGTPISAQIKGDIDSASQRVANVNFL